jgi:Flp pilus assembly protein TadD
LGWQLLSYDRDYPSAAKEFQRAIELNPSNADAHDGLANYLAVRGQFDDSVAEARRARELDPLSLVISHDFGKMLFYARRALR